MYDFIPIRTDELKSHVWKDDARVARLNVVFPTMISCVTNPVNITTVDHNKLMLGFYQTTYMVHEMDRALTARMLVRPLPDTFEELLADIAVGASPPGKFVEGEVDLFHQSRLMGIPCGSAAEMWLTQGVINPTLGAYAVLSEMERVRDVYSLALVVCISSKFGSLQEVRDYVVTRKEYAGDLRTMTSVVPWMEEWLADRPFVRACTQTSKIYTSTDPWSQFVYHNPVWTNYAVMQSCNWIMDNQHIDHVLIVSPQSSVVAERLMQSMRCVCTINAPKEQTGSKFHTRIFVVGPNCFHLCGELCQMLERLAKDPETQRQNHEMLIELVAMNPVEVPRTPIRWGRKFEQDMPVTGKRDASGNVISTASSSAAPIESVDAIHYPAYAGEDDPNFDEYCLTHQMGDDELALA